ncbi:Asp-tRNA(Asn)/Glu-tRNA(Gln) amidotransferase subunit GatA [Siphonobacter sp. SORGH_AS_1065]|uniref:Asp-tRNA(Asn)/Glu-tRNA(Gln) amidotransferase subunit GatA n=1 Tax=Siphonobacter sp. SORGH_AS_1065 TaxID=3041795 RepID=UPI002782CBEE|nr:Asp-tRNA(Asn)/Glu-tRNA(Gln) amidotransferase subunit GatA [Siphonobacter sp. SORGH_AS_1065]MDQ1087502.1 aspartyl-tRNA(Asn)/glutamyl-tRNA(Gln) amidotransferase subunit A [Siphonobacter sp. SORGH_AS_1065]
MKYYSSFRSLQQDLRQGTTSCLAMVDYYLNRIENHTHLNAFLDVYANDARTQASRVDAKLAAGTAGKLAGMVIGIKDLLCYADHGVQGGSKILNGFVSQFTATAVQRLLDADAVIIGRQNCDEFGMGSSNENSAFGPVRNAFDESRVPGGSSGGSAVAVQADLCFASIGTDTGGSVRQPAAFCGVVGLKPTYSRVSRWGLLAYASSFDTIGPITRCVEDAALILEVMAGADEQDSTVSQTPVPAYSEKLTSGGLRKIGYFRESIDSEGVDESVKAVLRQTIERLQAEGHTLVPIDFPLAHYYLPTYYILTTAEVSSNLSRYDGVRYGYRSPQAVDLDSLYRLSRTEGLGSEARKRILLGTFVLSANYYDAYYTKAQRVRRLIKEEIERHFQEVDFILYPTTPSVAFPLGEKSSDPLKEFLADIFTVQANLTGTPAISLPLGKDRQGLSVGIQVIAPAFGEEQLLAFAKSLEGITEPQLTM